MAYSTAQVVPSSSAVVHPSIRHPSPWGPKYTTSKPDRAPRWCHAAVAGTGAKDMATTFPPMSPVPKPARRDHQAIGRAVLAEMSCMGIIERLPAGTDLGSASSGLWPAETASRTPADGDATDADCRTWSAAVGGRAACKVLRLARRGAVERHVAVDVADRDARRVNHRSKRSSASTLSTVGQAADRPLISAPGTPPDGEGAGRSPDIAFRYMRRPALYPLWWSPAA